MKGLGIAVVQWNHAEYTTKLIESVVDNLGENNRIAICDNGSEIREWEYLVNVVRNLSHHSSSEMAQSDWDIALIRNSQNSGFAAGINQSIRKLLETNVEWIWLLNNDITMNTNVVTTLKKALVNLSPGMYGTRIGDSSGNISSGAIKYNKWTTKFKNLTDNQLEPKLDNGDVYPNGASMLIHRTIFNSVGLLSERTFLYFEELDFVKRLNRIEGTLGWIPEVVVDHIGGGSLKVKDMDKKRMYHETWSTLDFYRTHHRFLFHFILLFRTPIRLVTLLLTSRYSQITSVLQGTLDCLRNYNRDKKVVEIAETRFFQLPK